MTEIALLLVAATVAYAISRALDQPPIPFLLVTGILVGLSGLIEAEEFVGQIMELALIFLLFVAGSELTTRRFRHYISLALQIGIAQFALLAAAGLGLAVLLGYTLTTAVYLGLAIAASSTLVVMRLLQRRRQMYEPFGRVLTGVLLIQDLIIVLMIPIITLSPEGTRVVLGGVVGTLILLGLAALMVQWGAKKLLVDNSLDRETHLLIMLSTLFAFAGLAWYLNVPLISAAFVAGIAFSGFPVGEIVRGELQSISDFFLVLFFTALGAAITNPGVIGILHASAFAVLVIVLTPPLVIYLSERAGLSARPALENGLLLAQTSEFSLVVALQGVAVGHISPDVFTIIALTTVITMVITPYLSHDRAIWFFVKHHPASFKESTVEPTEGHIVLIGCGKSMWPVLESLVDSGEEVIVIDEDPSVTDRLHAAGVRYVRGDGADSTVLEAAYARKARAIVSTLRRRRDATPILEFTSDTPVLVRVFEEHEAEFVESHGGIPLLYSEAGAEGFLEWFDEHESRLKVAE